MIRIVLHFVIHSHLLAFSKHFLNYNDNLSLMDVNFKIQNPRIPSWPNVFLLGMVSVESRCIVVYWPSTPKTCHSKDGGSAYSIIVNESGWQYRTRLNSHGTLTNWCTGREWPGNCMTVISAWWRSNMPFQRRRKCIFNCRGRVWLTIWDRVNVPRYTHRLMHRKRVTWELHDSYFRLMTIKHAIPKTAEVTHSDGQSWVDIEWRRWTII